MLLNRFPQNVLQTYQLDLYMCTSIDSKKLIKSFPFWLKTPKKLVFLL